MAPDGAQLAGKSTPQAGSRLGAGGGRAGRRGVGALRLQPRIGTDGKAGKRRRGRSAAGNHVGDDHADHADHAGFERHAARLCYDASRLGHRAAVEHDPADHAAAKRDPAKRDPARVEHYAGGHCRAGADEERSRRGRDGTAQRLARPQALDGGDRRRRAGGGAAGALRRLGVDALACDRAALDQVAELLLGGGKLQGLGHLGGVSRLGEIGPLKVQKPSKIKVSSGPSDVRVTILGPS